MNIFKTDENSHSQIKFWHMHVNANVSVWRHYNLKMADGRHLGFWKKMAITLLKIDGYSLHFTRGYKLPLRNGSYARLRRSSFWILSKCNFSSVDGWILIKFGMLMQNGPIKDKVWPYLCFYKNKMAAHLAFRKNSRNLLHFWLIFLKFCGVIQVSSGNGSLDKKCHLTKIQDVDGRHCVLQPAIAAVLTHVGSYFHSHRTQLRTGRSCRRPSNAIEVE